MNFPVVRQPAIRKETRHEKNQSPERPFVVDRGRAGQRNGDGCQCVRDPFHREEALRILQKCL